MKKEDGESTNSKVSYSPVSQHLAFRWQLVHLVEQPLGALLRVQPHQFGHPVTHPIRDTVNLHKVWEHLPWLP